jgi:hypothetical protein
MKTKDGLKARIAELKWILEDPSYDFTDRDRRADEAELARLREELSRAAEDGEDTASDENSGGEINTVKHGVTVDEARLATFEKRLPYIRSVMLSICGHFSGFRTFTAIVEPSGIRLVRTYSPTGDRDHTKTIECSAALTRAEFFAGLEALRLGEWEERYDPERYGSFVMDGVHWHLEIAYKGRRKSFNSRGANLFPYNYKRLVELMSSLNPK